MKAMRKIMASLLALTMAASAGIGALADGNKIESTAEGENSASVPVAITAEAPTTFSVKVPSSLPLTIKADGSVEVPTNLMIENDSAGPVKVTKIEATKGAWGLAEYGSNFDAMSVNAKKLGFKLNDATTIDSTDNTQTLANFDASKWTIGGNKKLPITVAADASAVSEAVENASAASVVFTIAWDEAEKYTVTFATGGGSTVASQAVTLGGKAAKPADPTRTNYTFGGWYTDEGCTTAYDFNTAVTGATTLYAKWVKVAYTVTFETNGGSDVTPQTIEAGCKATRPADPSREGYTFDGWYADESCTTTYDFNAAITVNTTIYAKWKEVERQTVATLTMKVTDDLSATVGFGATVANGITIDWGDGKEPTTSDSTEYKVYTHDYDKENTYTVTLTTATGCDITFASNKTIAGTTDESRGKLTSAVMEDTVTRIGDYAFRKCSALTSVAIPDSVTSIGNFAFDGCAALKSVTIPDSVTSIGGYAFSGCTSLTCVAIPDSVTNIGNFAFRGCSALKSVTIQEGVTSIGSYAFCDCSVLTSVTIPSSVTSIGEYAFYGSALTSVTIPDSVTSMGGYVFCCCSALKSVTIPSSVTSIESGVFRACDALKSVTMKGTTPPALDSYAFLGTSGFTIYVPSSAVNNYKSATNWSSYANSIKAG